MEKALKAQARKYLDIALTLQAKAVKKLQTINLDIDPDALTVTEARALLNDAVKLEYLALGVPSENIRVGHTGDLKVKKCLFLDEMEEEEAKIARL